MESPPRPSARDVLSLISSLVDEAYVVGGIIRDRLMGAEDCADLDLAVRGDGFVVARQAADRLGKGCAFVPLDEENGTGRIVVGRTHFSLDVSSLKGDDILEDLSRRDFTMNAVAVSLADFLRGKDERVIDPTGGAADILRRVVRACSDRSFRDDPLRILRAFRFNAALDFRISQGTLELIQASLQALESVSPERIRDEMVAILSTPHCWGVLREMDRRRVLDSVFPELLPMKGCGQSHYHHLDVWEHSLEVVRTLEALLQRIEKLFGERGERVRSYVNEEPVRGRPRAALLKLAALFHDSGKPATRTVDATGRTRFFGHERLSRSIFEEAATRLKLANREINVMAEWIGGHMRPMILTGQPPSRRALYRLHRAFDREIIGLYLLFLADLGATRGPARAVGDEKRALVQVQRALETYFEIQGQARPPLLNGHDVMSLFAIAAGPYLGSLLNRLAELEGSGEVTTREQAVEAVEEFIRQDTDTLSDQ